MVALIFELLDLDILHALRQQRLPPHNPWHAPSPSLRPGFPAQVALAG